MIVCLYKIIFKILTTRLKTGISMVIDEVQIAYFEGHYIMDGHLIINEVCFLAKKFKNKVLLFKLDLRQSF